MSAVSIQFSLQYIDCNLSDRIYEQLPVVSIYYDGHFTRATDTGGIVRIPLDENDLNKVYTTTLKATLPPRQRGVHPGSRIGMASYAMRRNDFGFLCYVDTGTADVSIGEIYNTLVVQKKSQFIKELSLILHTTKQVGDDSSVGIEKGKLLLMVHKMESPPLLSNIQSPLISMAAEELGSLLMQNVEQNMQGELSIKDTFPGTSQMRAPMDISESGIELTGNMYLPSWAFSLAEVPRNNGPQGLAVWKNALDFSMNDMGYTTWAELDTKEKCRMLGKVVSQLAQSFDYVSDTYARGERKKKMTKQMGLIPFENFTSSLETASGDCEDGSGCIGQTWDALKQYVFAEEEVELREMQSLMSNYIFLHNLAVVHGAKADDATESFGAHMYGIAMDKQQFQRALTKTNEGRAFISRYMNDKGPSKEEIEGIGYPAAAQEEPLPLLTLEGTGKLDPIGRRDPLIEKKRFLSQHVPTLRGYKSEIPREEGKPSPFYYGVLFSVTNHFLNSGINVGGFVLGTTTTNEGGMTRGVRFTDLINQNDNFAIMPQPPAPLKVVEVAREAVLMRVPPHRLELDVKLPFSGTKNRHLDSMLNGLRRPASSSRVEPVDYFIRPHQINADLAKQLTVELANLESSLVGISYVCERMTTKLHRYRLRVYVE